MKSPNLLGELIDRVAALQGKAALISDEELNQWPVEEITALKEYKLLQKARPATSVVCVECEEACVRPVHTVPDPGGESRLFLVCEKQSDVNRISIPMERLEQWQTMGDYFVGLVAELLNLRQATKNQTTATRWEVGLFKGRKHSSHLMLTIEDTLQLNLAGHRMALADVLSLEVKQFTIDKKILTRLVDKPVSGGGDIESAEQRRMRIQKRVNELKTQGVNAFLKTVAEEEGISTSRIKQLIQDNEPAPKRKKPLW